MDDHELLSKIRDPETRNYGFNMLVRTYQQKVYWLVRKMVIDHDDADDVTQEVFIKVHKSIETFRADSQLYTWLYRVATNECLTFLQKKRRRLIERMRTPRYSSWHHREARRREIGAKDRSGVPENILKGLPAGK